MFKFCESVLSKFNTEEVIKELSRCTAELREKLGLEKVILFGSYAKENYTVASDIDLLIIIWQQKATKMKFINT